MNPKEIWTLTADLCEYATGVVTPENAAFFERIAEELPLTLHRYPSGQMYNGWTVPQSWHVTQAAIYKDGEQIFDGTVHPLGVAAYSRSFEGEMDLASLKQHLVTHPQIPEAYVYHCMWQYRPWDVDWAMSMPYQQYEQLTPGQYRVELITVYEPGEMLVATCDHQGATDQTLVFNAHTCHPKMANDDFAGVAVLIRLFQWLQTQETYYSYRLVLGPEHLGTVFYLKDQSSDELARLVSGAFAEMPGTKGAVKIASTFLGNQPIDRAFHNAARHETQSYERVPWRQGAGNDETVWEAPGYEVPFVEVSRCEDLLAPFREYHTSLDTAELMQEDQLGEFYQVFESVVRILENDARLYRYFDGLICLSNPAYDLYMERPDPAVVKDLDADSEKWGYLLDNIFRYMDGSMTVLDIAEKHDLSFHAVHAYISKFRDKGLIDMEFAPLSRPLITQKRGELNVFNG